LKIDLTDFPKLKTVILDAKLSVRIIFNEVKIDLQKYEHFLGAQHLRDSCSKLEILLNAVDNLTDAQVTFLELLNKVSKTLNTINEQDLEENTATKMKILVEQVNLLKSKKHLYSPDFLLFSCTFSYTFPTAYKFLREQNIITAQPHVSESFFRPFMNLSGR
jgi:serine protease inhibitor